MDSSTSDYSLADDDNDQTFRYDDDDGDDDDEDEAGIFGPRSGCSDRGSYRNDSGSEYEEGGRGKGGATGSEEGSDNEGLLESLSLYRNSSEWTPLRGTEFAAPSSRQDRPGDWSLESAEKEKVQLVVPGKIETLGVHAKIALRKRLIHGATKSLRVVRCCWAYGVLVHRNGNVSVPTGTNKE